MEDCGNGYDGRVVVLVNEWVDVEEFVAGVFDMFGVCWSKQCDGMGWVLR
jgi:hypothetical protein